MSVENPIHLGDGAYATYTGYGITLTANDHDERRATDAVHLDPRAVENLVQWIERLKKESHK